MSIDTPKYFGIGGQPLGRVIATAPRILHGFVPASRSFASALTSQQFPNKKIQNIKDLIKKKEDKAQKKKEERVGQQIKHKTYGYIYSNYDPIKHTNMPPAPLHVPSKNKQVIVDYTRFFGTEEGKLILYKLQQGKTIPSSYIRIQAQFKSLADKLMPDVSGEAEHLMAVQSCGKAFATTLETSNNMSEEGICVFRVWANHAKNCGKLSADANKRKYFLNAGYPYRAVYFSSIGQIITNPNDYLERTNLFLTDSRADFEILFKLFYAGREPTDNDIQHLGRAVQALRDMRNKITGHSKLTNGLINPWFTQAGGNPIFTSELEEIQFLIENISHLLELYFGDLDFSYDEILSESQQRLNSLNSNINLPIETSIEEKATLYLPPEEVVKKYVPPKSSTNLKDAKITLELVGLLNYLLQRYYSIVSERVPYFNKINTMLKLQAVKNWQTKHPETTNWLIKHPEMLPLLQHADTKQELNKIRRALEKKREEDPSLKDWGSWMNAFINLRKAEKLEAEKRMEAQKAKLLGAEIRWKDQLKGGRLKTRKHRSRKNKRYSRKT
jgi:hypothetical protein